MEVHTSRKLIFLSFAILWGLSDVWAQITMPNRNMEVIQGQMVVLKAWYSPAPGTDKNANTLLWTFVGNDTELIISYSRESSSVDSPMFEGRVGFTAAAEMPSTNLSLYINNTKESDSGRYLCQVIIPQGKSLTSELTLNVKVPPAVPKCSLSGKPVLKGNVTLSCKSSSGKPIPMYRWRKTSPTSEVFFSPMLNEKMGTLKLSNLSSNMSGKYMCTASNTAGHESCIINLEIITSTNAGVIAGATVGSVVGFIILLLFLIFLVKRRRDMEDDMANEIKEDAQAPKRVSWAKSGMGSDIISKNGTLSSITSNPHQREPSHHHHHHHLQQYPQRPPSDTASIITATGSTAGGGYRPSRHHGQHGASTPTHYGGYNSSATLPHDRPSSETSVNGGSPAPRMEERFTPLPQAQAVPQAYSQPHYQPQAAAPGPPPLPTGVVTAANISRMGGVPIMVPAQNQAGSLV